MYLNTVYLSLGSNLGDPIRHLDRAIELLFEQIGSIVKISPVYTTQAWGFKAPDFKNCVVQISTSLAPNLLLEALQIIESKMGRSVKTAAGYQSRIIDIDILLFNDDVINSSNLIVPHEHMCERLFVLQPLHDIAPGVVHPEVQKTVKQLLGECNDNTEVHKNTEKLDHPINKIPLSTFNYVAIEGNIGAGKTSLVQMIAAEFNAKPIFERFADNPFLPKFYQDKDRFAFPLEMSFLADRYQQLFDDIGQFDLFNDFIVADYDRYKSLIFARVTLQKEEYQLYQRLHQLMYRDMAQPDLYIYLYQNTDRLLQNIKNRGRSYEQQIAPEYLQKINTGYLDFIKSHADLNVKILDISDIDFVKNRSDFIHLMKQIALE